MLTPGENVPVSAKSIVPVGVCERQTILLSVCADSFRWCVRQRSSVTTTTPSLAPGVDVAVSLDDLRVHAPSVRPGQGDGPQPRLDLARSRARAAAPRRRVRLRSPRATGRGVDALLERRDGLNRPRRPSHHIWVRGLPGRLPGRHAPLRRLHESIIADGRAGVRRGRFGIR
jgi:hypothetical protein